MEGGSVIRSHIGPSWLKPLSVDQVSLNQASLNLNLAL